MIRLLLVRVQGDINTIGLKLRDMRDMGATPRKRCTQAHSDELNRVRADLQDAIEWKKEIDPLTRQRRRSTPN